MGILLSFVVYYTSINLLQTRLELNLLRSGKAINTLLKSEEFSISEVDTPKDSLYRLQSISDKWNKLFSKYLINPFNYYFRIYDTNTKVIWLTSQISDNNDIEISNKINDFTYITYSTSIRKATPAFLRYENFEAQLPRNKSQIIRQVNLNDKMFNILTFRSKNLIISVAQPYTFFIDFRKGLVSILLITIGISSLLTYLVIRLFLRNPFTYIDRLSKSLNHLDFRNKEIATPEPPKYQEFQSLSGSVNEILSNMTESYHKLARFSSNVAHELKTPLTILRGELSIALQTPKTQEQYELVIASALEESVRLSGVVDALLELARADTGQIKMNLKKDNFSELIEEIAEDCEILGEEKNILINTKIEKNIQLTFDTDRMHQAILNIIDNAIKYTNPKGMVSIELTRNASNAVLKVIDTGIGISPENIEKIFERFFRTDDVKMKSISGLGLGLTMVKWIIDAHNGEIVVQSKVGEGTAFIISIPIV